MKRILIVFMLLICLGTVQAASFRLIDAVTQQPIADSFVLMKLYAPDNTLLEVNGATNDSIIDFSVPPGKYDVGFYIDTLSTPGRDYYANVNLNIEDSTARDILVLPIASLNGRVIYDSAIVATNAKVWFDCDKDFGIEYPPRTDSVGRFSVAYIPTGGCLIQAKLGNKYGSENVVLAKGEKEEIVLNLNQELSNSLSYILAGLVVLVIGLVIFFWRKKKPRAVKLETEDVQAAIKIMRMTDKETLKEIEKDKRIQDILSTLNKDERAVADFLIQHKFKASQPQIFKATLIPRTTIARQLISLEAKKILQSRKVRKIKEVELTDWFIGEHK